MPLSSLRLLDGLVNMSGFLWCSDTHLNYSGYTGKGEEDLAELFQCDQTSISPLPDQEYIISNVSQIFHSGLSNLVCARHIQRK